MTSALSIFWSFVVSKVSQMLVHDGLGEIGEILEEWRDGGQDVAQQ